MMITRAKMREVLADKLKGYEQFAPFVRMLLYDPKENLIKLLDAAVQAGMDFAEQSVAAERERIATGLMDEADNLPCQKDGEIYRSAAWLVRGDFSYGEAERLETAAQTRKMKAEMNKIEEIRERWRDESWPSIGYFVHGQARLDLRDLLSEVDRLRLALGSVAEIGKDETGMRISAVMTNIARNALRPTEQIGTGPIHP